MNEHNHISQLCVYYDVCVFSCNMFAFQYRAWFVGLVYICFKAVHVLRRTRVCSQQLENTRSTYTFLIRRLNEQVVSYRLISVSSTTKAFIDNTNRE